MGKSHRRPIRLSNHISPPLASQEQLTFNKPHAPEGERVFAAFNHVVHDIKTAVKKSRKLWEGQDTAGPLQMWGKAKDLTDAELLDFTIEKDLKLVSSATASYGIIILGKIQIPAIDDGYIHVRFVC